MLLPCIVSSPTSKVTQVTDDLMPKGVALYDYNAGSDQEISFKVIIHLVDLYRRLVFEDIHEVVFHPFRPEMCSTC